AAQQATEAARDIAEEAATALNRAVQEATTAADTAAGALAEAAREALDSATGAGAASPEASGQALAAIAASAGMTEADVEAVLSVEGFDHDRAAAVIAASDLGDLRKTLLTTALAQAQGNPELLQLALDQTRGALGL
ncbi:MAG: translation initiation factor 3, partial [Paracoccaceae bacterium]|nr:translation initiation factor 3 [Paracoccaceae bacterium]